MAEETTELERIAGTILSVPPSGDAVEQIAALALKSDHANVERIMDRNGVDRLLLVKTRDADGDQDVQVLDLDEHGDAGPPDVRVKGTYTLHTIDALIDYAAPFTTPQTTAWVDGDAAEIRVVFDDHAPVDGAASGLEQDAGRREHVAVLKLRDSPEWSAWAALDGQYIGQEQFAMFLEDQIRTVVAPPAAKLLEMVTAFESTVTGKFASSMRLDNGERNLVYEETVTDGGKSKGGAGVVKLPEALTLTLRRFVGEEHQQVRARFRRRQQGTTLAFGVVLDDVVEITEQAVLAVAAKLEAAVPRTYSGTGQRQLPRL